VLISKGFLVPARAHRLGRSAAGVQAKENACCLLRWGCRQKRDCLLLAAVGVLARESACCLLLAAVGVQAQETAGCLLRLGCWLLAAGSLSQGSHFGFGGYDTRVTSAL
jgi:hypothetical protein